jgi:predicted nucleic acid-binding protein
VATFLADKSALTRRETKPEVRAVIEPMLLAGQIATCGIVDLELLYSASSPAVYERLASALRADLTVLHYDADYDRIAEVTRQPVQWVLPRGSVA